MGCGRYKNADAQKHYKQSNHTLSYDMESGRVWNYTRDCFSHRVTGKELMMEETEQVEQVEESEHTFWKYCAIISEQLE